MNRASGAGVGTAGAVDVSRSRYSRAELMIVAAARALRDGERVLVGIGLPNLACNLARRLHAPKLELVYESGVIGAAPERQALSIGDPCLVSGAASVCSVPELFLYYLQGGRIDVGFLGGAQIDRFGNINTTVIGPYTRPRVRLPGAGGAPDIAAFASRVFIVGKQSRRSFVDRVDFITSPGHAAENGRPRGGQGHGPQLAVTDLGIYGFDATRGTMVLRSLHPGVTFEEAQSGTGWTLDRMPDLQTTPPPTDEELRLLREELDPKGRHLKTTG
jgi:glutaconate CoA-transferase subunit B